MRYRNRSPEAAPNENEGDLTITPVAGAASGLPRSAVLPRAADGCIARMMRMPNGARLTSDATLLLS